MPTDARSRKLYLALSVNAGLLALILASMWARHPAAIAQVPPAAAAAVPGGVTIMPAQLSPQTWGCYLLDAERQTLCVYTFRPGEPDLRLVAARDVSFDRGLKQFNTSPTVDEIRRLAERATTTPRAPAKD